MKLTKIKEVLDDKGLKRSKLVKDLGVTSRTIAGWVSDKNPPIRTLYKVAAILGVPVKELLLDNNPFAQPENKEA